MRENRRWQRPFCFHPVDTLAFNGFPYRCLLLKDWWVTSGMNLEERRTGCLAPGTTHVFHLSRITRRQPWSNGKTTWPAVNRKVYWIDLAMRMTLRFERQKKKVNGAVEVLVQDDGKGSNEVIVPEVQGMETQSDSCVTQSLHERYSLITYFVFSIFEIDIWKLVRIKTVRLFVFPSSRRWRR